MNTGKVVGSDASYIRPVSSTGKPVPVKRKVIVELLETLGCNNDKCANGRKKRVGHLTQEKRKTAMMCFVADMNILGYHLLVRDEYYPENLASAR